MVQATTVQALREEFCGDRCERGQVCHLCPVERMVREHEEATHPGYRAMEALVRTFLENYPEDVWPRNPQGPANAGHVAVDMLRDYLEVAGLAGDRAVVKPTVSRSDYLRVEKVARAAKDVVSAERMVQERFSRIEGAKDKVTARAAHKLALEASEKAKEALIRAVDEVYPTPKEEALFNGRDAVPGEASAAREEMAKDAGE